jgi:hypothetical protein
MEVLFTDPIKVCRGQIVRTDYYGQIMYVLGASDTLYVTAFQGSWEDDYFDIPSQLNGNHLFVTAPLNTSSVTQADAAQNQVILFQGSFTDTPVQTSFSYFSFVTGVGSGVNVEGYAFESTVVRGNYDWSNRTLSGLWFDPGLLYPGNTYTTGTFDLSVSNDWEVISGTFSNYYVDETVPCTRERKIERDSER